MTSKMRHLKRRLPILNWIAKYSKQDAVSDFIAGVTICLTMIPQSIAYAELAGLSPQYGLNSSFVGCFVYVVFGSVKEVVIAISSLTSLLTIEYTRNLPVEFVILLTFLSGLVELLMAAFNLGFLIEFIPAPVLSGFTSATAIIIIVSQLKGICGLRFKPKGFLDNVYLTATTLKDIKVADLVLGLVCIILLLSLKKLKEIELPDSVRLKGCSKILWFLATARNAIAVCTTSCVTLIYLYSFNMNPPFITTEKIQSGLPAFQLPPTSAVIGNTTIPFLGMVRQLGSGIIVIPIVCVSANIAIAKAFTPGSIDATQEIGVLALSNIIGSFLQSTPVAGAFTRSAVMNASGVRTPLAHLYAGCLSLLALQFLTPFFYLIPRATLSAILIAAVYILVDTSMYLPLWRSSKPDFAAALISLVACLFLGVQLGLLIGVVIGACYLMYMNARPPIEIQMKECFEGSYIEATLKSNGLYYPAVHHLSTILTKEAYRSKFTSPIFLRCRFLDQADYTAAKGLNHLQNTFDKLGFKLIFVNIPSCLLSIWEESGMTGIISCSEEEIEQYLMDEPSSAMLAHNKE